ncbi:hypothetical protein CEXT_575071 [Caerostris extrusa]|uniref:Secreted protein n=1 Tax=Caerostris extrusa TaxID=172846 RepID=A0AAV4RGI4_CAEEX|nr:hypothetical protein CEXT_575071 [Caerostris extrusa]
MTLLPSVWPVTTAWPDGPTNTPEVTSCWCCSCWFMAPHPEDWKKKPNLFCYRSCSFQSSNFSSAKVESSSLFVKKFSFAVLVRVSEASVFGSGSAVCRYELLCGLVKKRRRHRLRCNLITR